MVLIQASLFAFISQALAFCLRIAFVLFVLNGMVDLLFSLLHRPSVTPTSPQVDLLGIFPQKYSNLIAAQMQQLPPLVSNSSYLRT